jgi:hypothetical protein
MDDVTDGDDLMVVCPCGDNRLSQALLFPADTFVCLMSLDKATRFRAGGQSVTSGSQRAVAVFVFAPAIAGARLISSDFHDNDTS